MRFTKFLTEDQAKEGEGPVLWHVSKNKLNNNTRYKPMSHFGDQGAARQRGVEIKRFEKTPVKSVHAVRIKHGNSFQVHDNDGEQHEPHSLLNHLHKNGMFNSTEHLEHSEKMKRIGDHQEKNNYLASAIRSKGYHSLHYNNRVEGGISHIITHPDQVRIIKSRTGITKSKSVNKGVTTTHTGLYLRGRSFEYRRREQ